jgi:hypothetical protein
MLLHQALPQTYLLGLLGVNSSFPEKNDPVKVCSFLRISPIMEKFENAIEKFKNNESAGRSVNIWW